MIRASSLMSLMKSNRVHHVRRIGNVRNFTVKGGDKIGKPKTLTNFPLLPLRVVEHPRTVAFLPILGHAAYLSLAGGFLCTDVLSLRIILVCGYSGLVVFHALHPSPLRIPLRWTTFFVLVNAGMATILILDMIPPTLTEEEEELHIDHFAPLTRKQFKTLLDLGRREIFTDGTELTHEDKPSHELFFILDGAVDMTHGGVFTSRLRRGGFPNWMSFQRTGWDPEIDMPNSYGTISCTGEVNCIVWDRDDLKTVLVDDDMRQRMNHVVTESLIRRLLHTPDSARVQDYIGVISHAWADVAVRQHRKKATLALQRTKRG